MPGTRPPGTNIAGYKVYSGTACRNYTNSFYVGNTTNATITGLTDGATYYCAATVVNTAGLESDYSVEASVTNHPPILDALGNLTITENADQQTVNLSGITSGAPNESQTLTITAISDNPALIPNLAVSYTSPNASGSLTFTPASSGFGTATITVTMNDNQATNNLTSRSFTVTVNPLLPGQTPFTNLYVLPNAQLRLALHPPYTNGDRITFSLAAGAPTGAAIQVKKGVSYLTWTPTSAQSSTTNLVVIRVNDATQPTLSTNQTAQIVLLDYVFASSTWSSVQAGQNCTLPLYLASSEGVTDVTFTIDWFYRPLHEPIAITLLAEDLVRFSAKRRHQSLDPSPNQRQQTTPGVKQCGHVELPDRRQPIVGLRLAAD